MVGNVRVIQKLTQQKERIEKKYKEFGEPYPINCDENGNFLGNVDYELDY